MATFPKHYVYVSNLGDGRDFYLRHCKIIKQKAHQKTSRFKKDVRFQCFVLSIPQALYSHKKQASIPCATSVI